MKNTNRINASLFGKMATVVVDQEKVIVYTTSTLMVILSVWIFGIAFFVLSLPINITLFNALATIAGGIVGFLLLKKLYIGKQHSVFPYENIECFVSKHPIFTIISTNKKMFDLKILKKSQAKLLMHIATEIADHKTHELVNVHGIYRVQEKAKQAD